MDLYPKTLPSSLDFGDRMDGNSEYYIHTIHPYACLNMDDKLESEHGLNVWTALQLESINMSRMFLLRWSKFLSNRNRSYSAKLALQLREHWCQVCLSRRKTQDWSFLLVKFGLAGAGFPFPLDSFVKHAEWHKSHHGKPDITLSLFYNRGVLSGYLRNLKSKAIEWHIVCINTISSRLHNSNNWG